MPIENQVVVVYAGTRGYLDKVVVANITKFESALVEVLKTKYQPLLDQIKKTKQISPEIDRELKVLFSSEKFI